MQVELDQERSTANYFESKLISAKCEVVRLVQQRDQRGWRKLCATAELHQGLHEAGKFDDPLNRTVDELHYHALKRIELGPQGVRRGGQPMQLTPTLRALAFAIYNKSSAPLYKLLRKVARWLPRRKKVARMASEAFVAQGCSQLAWGKQAFRIFKAVDYDPGVQPFGICLDAAKLTGKLTWDVKAERWVGQIDFDSRLGFSSWEDMQNFLQTKVAAGYVLVFLLCPLSPVIPSIVLPVGILPTDLTYTHGDLDRHVDDIYSGLTSAALATCSRPLPLTMPAHMASSSS